MMLCCIAVASSCPHCLSYPSQQARYTSLDAEVLWCRTSHRYTHTADTAVHISTPCSVSSDLRWCSRDILDCSMFLPCASLIGWYTSLVSCIGAAKYGQCLNLCVLSSVLWCIVGITIIKILPMEYSSQTKQATQSKATYRKINNHGFRTKPRPSEVTD